ncbi:hypothetical protein ACJX0J_036067, partial [Zea mays]
MEMIELVYKNGVEQSCNHGEDGNEYNEHEQNGRYINCALLLLVKGSLNPLGAFSLQPKLSHATLNIMSSIYGGIERDLLTQWMIQILSVQRLFALESCNWVCLSRMPSLKEGLPFISFVPSSILNFI